MMCKHLKDGVCEIATKLAGIDARAAASTCMACQADIMPMQVNKPTCGLAVATLHRAGLFDHEKHQDLVRAAMHDRRIHYGPGTELEKLINSAKDSLPWFFPKDWFFPKGDCPMCKDLKYKMNAWGTDGCERRIKRILVKMRDNAQQNGIAFVATAAEGYVRKAIQIARDLDNQLRIQGRS